MNRIKDKNIFYIDTSQSDIIRDKRFKLNFKFLNDNRNNNFFNNFRNLKNKWIENR